jgi:hypothetical protein
MLEGLLKNHGEDISEFLNWHKWDRKTLELWE